MTRSQRAFALGLRGGLFSTRALAFERIHPELQRSSLTADYSDTTPAGLDNIAAARQALLTRCLIWCRLPCRRHLLRLVRVGPVGAVHIRAAFLQRPANPDAERFPVVPVTINLEDDAVRFRAKVDEVRVRDLRA